MLKETKLRDVTPEQFKNYDCLGIKCDDCPLKKEICANVENCWVNHKDLYSDKFLDQTIDIEVPDPVVLTKEEHDYLEAVIKPFRCLVKFIEKRSGASVIVFKNEHKENIAILPLRDICLSEMKSDYTYKIEELGL